MILFEWIISCEYFEGWWERIKLIVYGLCIVIALLWSGVEIQISKYNSAVVSFHVMWFLSIATVTDTVAISLHFSIEIFKGDTCGSVAMGKIYCSSLYFIIFQWSNCWVWKISNHFNTKCVSSIDSIAVALYCMYTMRKIGLCRSKGFVMARQ